MSKFATRSRITLYPDAVAFEPSVVPPVERTYQRAFSADGVLGEGGMGKVVAARDRRLGRRVAIKELRAEVRGRADHWGRFVREAQIGGQLEHPNIVPVYGFELSPDGGPAFIMQLVEGESLAGFIERAQGAVREPGRKASVPSQKDRIAKLLPVCDAIAYAHGRGVLHRDLKPDNIMLGAHNVVLVTDWGIARVESDDPEERDEGQRASIVVDHVSAALGASDSNSTSPTVAVDGDQLASSATLAAASGPAGSGPAVSSGSVMTAVGTVMGTPQYMSPEQAIGLPLGPSSDQYSLGLILLELATLRNARSHENASSAYGQAVLGEHCEHRNWDDSDLDPRLSAVVRRSTAKNPQERYMSVDAFAADIRAYMRGEELSALPDSLARKVARHVARHPGRAVATVATLFLLLLGWALVGSLKAAERAQLARKDAEALSHLTSAVLADAEGIQHYLSGLEAELVGLTHTTRVRLETTRPPEAQSVHLVTPADLARGRVPDLVVDPVDGVARSFREPVFLFLRGATAAAQEDAQRLAVGKSDLMQLYLSELDEGALTRSFAEQQELMTTRHGGFERLMVVLESGAFVQFPGRGDLAGDYDPRPSPWYPQTLASSGTRFSRPKFGPLGTIPRLALSHRVSVQGKVVGAVNGAIWLSALTERLGKRHADWLEEPFIVGGDGSIVASRRLLEDIGKHPGEPEQAISLPRVSSARLAEAIARQRGHGYVVDGQALYIFAKLGIEDLLLVHRYTKSKYLRLVR